MPDIYSATSNACLIYNDGKALFVYVVFIPKVAFVCIPVAYGNIHNDTA